MAPRNPAISCTLLILRSARLRLSDSRAVPNLTVPAWSAPFGAPFEGLGGRGTEMHKVAPKQNPHLSPVSPASVTQRCHKLRYRTHVARGWTGICLGSIVSTPLEGFD